MNVSFTYTYLGSKYDVDATIENDCVNPNECTVTEIEVFDRFDIEDHALEMNRIIYKTTVGMRDTTVLDDIKERAIDHG